MVLILGFGGAKPKYIAKYSTLYESLGCSTVSRTATNYDVFVDHAGLDIFAKEAVEQVAKVVREEDDAVSCTNGTHKHTTPIVMHILLSPER